MLRGIPSWIRTLQRRTVSACCGARHVPHTLCFQAPGSNHGVSMEGAGTRSLKSKIDGFNPPSSLILNPNPEKYEVSSILLFLVS